VKHIGSAVWEFVNALGILLVIMLIEFPFRILFLVIVVAVLWLLRS
jgi:hypothetical protein